jgi:endonuclease YncB( thermonuclease family)
MARRRAQKSRRSHSSPRRRARYLLIVLIVLLISAAAGDRLGIFRYRGNDWRRIDQQVYVVAHVIDGNTVELERPGGGGRTRVRLLGIDAPVPGSEHPWGEPSRDYLRRRTEGREVVVRLEAPQTRDGQGRVLAYLFLGDQENLNLAMVRDGHAYADRRTGHSLRPQFELAENEARQRGRGLWREVTEEQMPEWRRHWLAEQRQRRSDTFSD